MATYNVDMTSKANKSFDNLHTRLINMHCRFEPSARRDQIKVITNYLHSATGYWLHTGDGADGMSYRYVRIVIDVVAGSKTATDKDELLRQTIECCMDYEGKKATDTEIEVRINEVEQQTVTRVVPAGSST